MADENQKPTPTAQDTIQINPNAGSVEPEKLQTEIPPTLHLKPEIIQTLKDLGYSDQDIPHLNIHHVSQIVTNKIKAPVSGIGPDTRPWYKKLGQQAEAWWTNHPAYAGTLDEPGKSPEEKAADFGKGVAIGGAPALVASGLEAPLMTATSVLTGLAGQEIGGAAGKKIGEKVGAPHLGEDVGQTVGAVAGAMAPGKIAAEVARVRETGITPSGEESPELGSIHMNRETVQKLKDLGYSNQQITNFNITDIHNIVTNKIPAPPASETPVAATPEVTNTAAPEATKEKSPASSEGGEISTHITFNTLGGKEVKAPYTGPERRGPDTFGRGYGSFPDTVNRTFETMREHGLMPSSETPSTEDAAGAPPKPNFPEQLDGRQIADHIINHAGSTVDEELVHDNYIGAKAHLKSVPIDSLTPGGVDHNIPNPSLEKKYSKMDPATMPPLVVEDGLVMDGNHRLRILQSKGYTHAWIYDVGDAQTTGPQGGHAGGGAASVEELNRPGRFVKVSRSGQLSDQGKSPDFNLRPGEVGYQVKPDGTVTVVDGQETPAHKTAIQKYAAEVFPSKTDISPRIETKKSVAPSAVGVHETDLPRSARYQDVNWSAPDLQDSGEIVTPGTIREDYTADAYAHGITSPKTKLSIYQRYIPMEDLPSASFGRVEGEFGDEDYLDPSEFDREDYYVPRGKMGSPIKVVVHKNGELGILDGNHRVQVWEEQNKTHAPAWVIDYRHSGIKNLSEDEEAEISPRLESQKIEIPKEKQGTEKQVLRKGGWLLPNGQNYVHDSVGVGRYETHGESAKAMGFVGPTSGEYDGWPVTSSTSRLSARLGALRQGAVRVTLDRTGTTTVEVFGITDQNKSRLIDALSVAQPNKAVYLAYGMGDENLPPKQFANPEEAMDWVDRQTPVSSQIETKIPEPQYMDTLARRGQLPNQKVNLSPAYGETGKYIGGHIDARYPGISGPDESAEHYTHRMGVTQGPTLLEIPKDFLPEGSTTHDVITHEFGHAIVADMMGLPVEGSEIQSHLHAQSNPGSAAAFTVDYSKIPGTSKVSGSTAVRFSQKALEDTWTKFLHTYVAGGVAQELAHGIPIEGNEGMTGDLRTLHRIGEMMGFTPEETQGMIDGSIAQTREMLDHPATLNIIKTAAGVREEGLPKTLHASAQKVADVIRQVREARNEGITKKDGVGDGAVISETEPRATGTGAEENVRGGDGKAVSARADASKVAAPPDAKKTLEKIAKRYGVSTNAAKIGEGASFITPEGKFIHLGINDHPQVINKDGYTSDAGDVRVPFINESGAIRTNFTTGRAGRTLSFSVPVGGVTPEQMDAMKAAVREGLGRNGELRIETADTPTNLKNAIKDFSSANDVEPMLRTIGAHPERTISPRLESNKNKPTAPVSTKQNLPVGSKFVPSSPEEYRAELDKSPRASVFLKDSAEELRNHQTFKLKTPNGEDTGIAYSITPEGEIRGVVNNGPYVGAATLAIKHGFEHGATRTETAWDVNGRLASIYKNAGHTNIVHTPYDYATYGDAPSVMKDAWKAAGWKETDPYPSFVHLEPDKSPDWHRKAEKDASKNESGGIDPRTGKSDSKGFGVEVMPELRQPLDHAPTAEDFKNYYDQHKDIFDAYPELRVGWDNNSAAEGGHEINIGAVGKDAARVAKKLDQKSAFDIAKGEIMPTGGTGLRTEFPNYPIEERIKDLKGENQSDIAGFEHLSKDVYDNLEPDERDYLKDNKLIQRNLMTQYHKIAPSVAETTNAMQAGAALGGWWKRYIDVFHGLLDEPALPIDVMWHGSPSGDLRGGSQGLHVGTQTAARQALEARIGIRADGKDWDGTQEYGKTLLAGKKTLAKLEEPYKTADANGNYDARGFRGSGYNADLPQDDHYPNGSAKYSDLTPIAGDAKPNITPVKIIGKMRNTPARPLTDLGANRIGAKIKPEDAGAYYTNTGEDSGSISAVVPSGSHIEQLANTIGPSHAEILKQWHAALSANKSVEDANNLAWHSYADWLDAGKPTDRKSINDLILQNGAQPEGAEKKGNAAISDTLGRRGKILKEGIDTSKIYNLVNSPEMRGEKPFTGDVFRDDPKNPLMGKGEGYRKVPSMGALVAGKGNLNRLVIDTHIADFYGQSGKSTAGRYIADSAHLRQAAKALGLKAAEGQEQLWGTVLGLKTLLKQGLTPEDVGGKLNADVINRIGKDYAEVIANDPEITKQGGLLDRLKEKYGIGRGSAGISAENRQTPSTGTSEGRSTSSQTTVDSALLGKTAGRIRNQISDVKIKKPATNQVNALDLIRALGGLNKTPIPTKIKQTKAAADNMNDPATRAAAARHESAHTVISEALNPGSVNSTGLTAGGGMTDVQPPAGKTTTEQLTSDEVRNMIAMLYAGGLSEPGGTTIKHASGDTAARAQVLAGRGTKEFLQAPELQAEARARVEALLADPSVQKNIDTLATHINAKGRLTGDEARTIIRGPSLTGTRK